MGNKGSNPWISKVLFQGFNKDSNNTHWAHTREQSANLSSTIQWPPRYRAIVGIFFSRRDWLTEVTGLTWGHTQKEQGDATCWACPAPWPNSEQLPGTWSLLWGKQCRRPYFGVNLLLDRNSNERCGNSGTHMEMALVSSLQGPLRTTDSDWQHWRDGGKMEWTRCGVTGTNINIFQKSSKLLKNKNDSPDSKFRNLTLYYFLSDRRENVNKSSSMRLTYTREEL